MFGGFKGFGGGFPFGGGEEEMMGGGQKAECDFKLYEVLGVPKTSSLEEIKRAYKKKVIRMHPDKGGDPEKFKEFQEAYEILSNPEKKELYDQYGMEGVKGNAGGDASDIFSQMFGFGGAGRQAQKPRKVKPVLKEVQITLDEAYSGKMLKLSISRKRVCAGCNGQGGTNVQKCTACKGHGIVTKMVMLGPGMYSQSQQPCKDCKGEGKQIEESSKCKECKGAKLKDEKKIVEVYIEPGVPEDYDYIMHGEADELPGIMAGDLYVRVKIQPHKTFRRTGADLVLEKEVTLKEALTGTSFEINYFEGKKFTVATYPTEILIPGAIKSLKEKGMPFFKDSMGHGHIFIHFNVKFPKKGEIKETDFEILQKILPGPNIILKDLKNPEYLEDFNENDTNPNPEGGKNKDYDEDEELRGGGTRVQCGQQ